jgi:sterol desaturase/sphingolipid hydroxylase (fatty acid hydroxylase superfamily)
MERIGSRSTKHKKQPDMPIIAEVKAIFKDTGAVLRFPNARNAFLIYWLLGAAALIYSVLFVGFVETALVAVISILLLPLVEFVVHRFVLHWLDLARNPITAKFWNRVHYAHHSQPSDPSVILAHPGSTVLLIGSICLLSWLIAGVTPLPIAGVYLLLFGFYEVVHFACHLPGELRSSYFARRRRIHALHHYMDENKNFGITSSFADRLFGTHATDKSKLTRSPTVRNLGYTGDFAERYPYIERRVE